jgi:mono/diheme cytochrome c family protein
MYDQPSYRPLDKNSFFPDGASARPLVAGTVARGQLREDEVFYTGKHGGQLVAEMPLDLDRALLERGRERFTIYCSMCHGQTGYGDGMIVRRGFRRPPSFHTDRLRTAPVGHFFDVITNGLGAMPTYNLQVEPRDRWAIAAYVRALQLSQHAELDDVPAARRGTLEEARP